MRYSRRAPRETVAALGLAVPRSLRSRGRGEDEGKTIAVPCGSSVFGNSAVLFAVAEAVLFAVAVADSQWRIYAAVPFAVAVADSQWHIISAVPLAIAETEPYAVREPSTPPN